MTCKAIGCMDYLACKDRSSRSDQSVRKAFWCIFRNADGLYRSVCLNREGIRELGEKAVPDGCYESVRPDSTSFI
jgi:hypothetical protein